MKSVFSSPFSKSANLLAAFAIQIAYPVTARPADHNPDRFASPAALGGQRKSDGYLKVYSATDRFDDGGTSYYAHSSYVVYTIDGKLFRSVENHISPSDEAPDIVALPAGNYTVEARSEIRGYVRLRVLVKPGRLTVVDLESEQSRAPAFALISAKSR